MIQAEKQATKSYRFPTLLMGYFLAAAGFSMFFRGTLLDALCAGLSGLATGLCLYFMNKLHANLFSRPLPPALSWPFWPMVWPLPGWPTTWTLPSSAP